MQDIHVNTRALRRFNAAMRYHGYTPYTDKTADNFVTIMDSYNKSLSYIPNYWRIYHILEAAVQDKDSNCEVFVWHTREKGFNQYGQEFMGLEEVQQ